MKNKISKSVNIPSFRESIDSLPEENKIFVDKSLEIADYIFYLLAKRGLKQKDLAELMEKTEPEISKLLSGMHNFTIRSLAKMEAALGSKIIGTPQKQPIGMPTLQVGKKTVSGIEAKISSTTPRLDYQSYGKVVQMSDNHHGHESAKAV